MTNDRPHHRQSGYSHAPAYDSYTAGGLIAAMSIIPLFVVVLAAPALVIAAALGAATVPLFERGVQFYRLASSDTREVTADSTTA